MPVKMVDRDATDQPGVNLRSVNWNVLTSRRVANHIPPNKTESNKMANAERTTYPQSSSPHGSSGGANAADASNDLASKGAAAFREVKANAERVIADAGEKGQQALHYAGQKGQEAMDGVREAGDTLAAAVEKSVTKRPYITLALALGLGFLFGAIWRR
jgi:ElaB/YqjD/DUF883 family membrane-anchored ribosome-binding protein